MGVNAWVPKPSIKGPLTVARLPVCCVIVATTDCSVCKTNYTVGLNFLCTPCTAQKWGVVIASVGGAVSLAVGVFVVVYLVSGDSMGSGTGLVDRIAYFIPLQSLKIVIVAWQIVTQVRPSTCQ